MSKKTIKRILFGMVLLSAFFISEILIIGAASAGQETEIIAVGEGTIEDNNVAGARNKAISVALKKAIEQYLSQYLGRQGMAGNFSSLIKNVIPNAGEDIENYHILAEERNGDICSILVRVKVNEKLMEQRLKGMDIVSIEASSIKILFMVSQKNNTKKDVSFWWNNPEITPALTTTELTLYNIFEEQGLRPINRLANIPLVTYSEDMTMQDLSDKAAIEWGRIFSADIIVKGECSVGLFDTVTVDLKAIKVEDGESICGAVREEVMNPEDGEKDRFMSALNRAIYNIAVEMAPQIIKAFERTNKTTNKINITIEDVNNFKEFMTIKKFLEEEIHGIKSVVQSRIKGRSMTVLVEFSGTIDELLNRLKVSKGLPDHVDISSADDSEIIIAIEHEMLDSGENRDVFIR